MCGDLNEQEQIDDELFERFIELTQHFGVLPEPTPTVGPRNSTPRIRARNTWKIFSGPVLRAVSTMPPDCRMVSAWMPSPARQSSSHDSRDF